MAVFVKVRQMTIFNLGLLILGMNGRYSRNHKEQL